MQKPQPLQFSASRAVSSSSKSQSGDTLYWVYRVHCTLSIYRNPVSTHHHNCLSTASNNGWNFIQPNLTVSKLELSQTRELAQHITDHVEDHDSHHLALDHDGAPPGEDGHTSRVLDWTVQYSWPGAGPVSADPYTTKTTCCSEGCGLVRLRFFLRHKQPN